LRYRILMLSVALALMVSVVHAHFVFVSPEEGGKSARVVMSEDLLPDLDVNMIEGTQLFLKSDSGSNQALPLERPDKNFFSVTIPGDGTRVVFGKTDFGVMQRGDSKPYLLSYYPKSVIGNALDTSTHLAADRPVELVPVGTPEAVRLKLIAYGKPVVDGEVILIVPGGTERKVKTGPDGITVEALDSVGQYGAWARFWEEKAGSHDGKSYEQIRHYATLVFNTNELAAINPQRSDSASSASALPVAAKMGTLPEATSSFGATGADGWLYVYGGHTAPTHVYSKEAVSGKFYRMRPGQGSSWEELPGGPGLQGMNLLAHQGLIYRVGGMAPVNEKGKRTNNQSVESVARFHPATSEWEALPALPQPLSSHDVAVIDNKLYVVGGWRLAGDEEDWSDSLLVLDLDRLDAGWQRLPQPFKRRALMAAAHDGKLWVVGGITDAGQVTRTVSVFDPKTASWNEGPQLPEGRFLGFSPAIAVHQGGLYAAVADGRVLRLRPGSAHWEEVATVEGRVAHRMVSMGEHLLVMGGATKGKNLDVVEAIPLDALSARR
jgi:hypothetical protein